MKSTFQRSSTSVLVVDDDPAISKLIKFNIQDKDTQVIEAATGFDGVRILREVRIDLLLLDLGLPDLDGWGVLDRLRASESLRNMPVIVVSAEPPDRNLIAQYRLNDYVQKPFDIRDLMLRVKRAIGLRPTVQYSG